MDRVKTISVDVLLSSELLSVEESNSLRLQLEGRRQLTAADVIALDLPAKNRVEALLRGELLDDKHLRELACDFAAHTLYVFEEHTPRDRRPRNCIEAARLFLAGGSYEELQAAIKEAIPVVWQLHGTKFTSAFMAGLAVTFLDCYDAAEMVQPVALHAQRAAHYKEWETRKSNLELMTGREKEATWQLVRIAEILS